MAIPVTNILQPGAISLSSGANRALISDLQLLTPQTYKEYVEKYGNEEFFQWLATYGGMELVKNRDFQWFESRGKLMIGVTPSTTVTGATAGATITVTLSSGDHYNSGTQSPVRVGETVRVASTNVEGEILAITDTTASAFQFTVRPKISTEKLATSGQASSLLATDTLLFGGHTDVGEASNSINPLIHLDEKKTNTITEMRESWKATDLAEMTEVFYEGSGSGSIPSGGNQAGTSMFTLKGLKKSNIRYLNNMENKLMRGNIVNNTGLASTTSVGTRGFLPDVTANAPNVTYSGTLDIAKLHEITRIMDVNGCSKENLWLQDIYQRQNFTDGIFAQFPAGAWNWGSSEGSEEAAVHYGIQSMYIDGYMFKAKKYALFNSEFTTGKSPLIDNFRDFGVICPQGKTRNASDMSGSPIKNITVMYQNPVGGGTTGNGIRVWQHGGGSLNPTNGQMVDQVEMIAYRGIRLAALNQFVVVSQ